ncbi:MAG TPA: ABC transporter ATP-binding protein [Candidatus Methanoperedens sp.]|nr:ABC transporter ATP-binding protein [Candidatus Methanoperedens sp.]
MTAGAAATIAAAGPAPVLLAVRGLGVAYGGIRAVRDVSFDVRSGEIVTLIGGNGAGKSSILRAISGVVPRAGAVVYDGADLARVPAHRIVGLGIAHVPEGRGIFGNLSVEENLRLATWQRRFGKGRAPRAGQGIGADLERVFAIFPRLKERLGQAGGTLSGGEQQMLAVGRALMSRPRLLLLDEPSMGLAPVLVREIFRVLAEINAAGTTILLVEQNANLALHAAHRAHVLETGAIVRSGTGRELLGDPEVRAAYLGG